MYRPKRLWSLHAPDDTEQYRQAIARLVSKRVVLGLTPRQVLDRMERCYNGQSDTVRRRVTHDEWCLYELARIQHDSAAGDGCCSTLGWYARVVKMRETLGVVRARQRRHHAARMRMRKLRAARRKRRAAQY